MRQRPDVPPGFCLPPGLNFLRPDANPDDGQHAPQYKPSDVGLKYADRCETNAGWSEMYTWVDFYANVMGFRNLASFDDKDISTEYTALTSKVMANGNERIKFPINEPAKGNFKASFEAIEREQERRCKL